MSVQSKPNRDREAPAEPEQDESELPEGRASGRFDSISELNPRHPSGLDDSQLVTFVPMTCVSESSPDFDRSNERPLAEVRKGYTHFVDGDVLFAKITPCMENGKGAVATGLKNGLGCGTTELHVIWPLGDIAPHYLYRFLQQESVRRDAAANFTGSAGQLRAPMSFIAELELTIPPLAEQRRIVGKLELLLGKVSSSQQSLSRVPGLLKRFRQSVLAAACSGKLTADWREEHAQDNKYTSNPLDEIADYVGGFAYRSPEFLQTGKHQVIRIGNVRPMQLNISAAPVFIHDELAAEAERFGLQPNDIVISMTGTKYKRDYGHAAMVEAHHGSLFLNQRVSRVRCGDKVLPRFLLYWMHSDLFRNHFFAGETGNVNQGNVGADGIRKAPIELPPLSEQQEIVRRAEKLFAFADQIESRLRQAQAHVDRITQSLLRKAFRGELVPTEHALAISDGRDYETAAALLTRVRTTNELGSNVRPESKRRKGTPPKQRSQE